MKNKPGYQDRVKSQTLSWAMGNPYHNTVDDECCPDFSCCRPELFESDRDKRWSYYTTINIKLPQEATDG